MNEATIQILLFVTPILMAVLAFIGALGVNALLAMGRDLNAIKVEIQKITSEHNGLEKRVEHIEKKLDV